jgi:hypothetical protein
LKSLRPEIEELLDRLPKPKPEQIDPRIAQAFLEAANCVDSGDNHFDVRCALLFGNDVAAAIAAGGEVPTLDVDDLVERARAVTVSREDQRYLNTLPKTKVRFNGCIIERDRTTRRSSRRK